jgi:hypothetical protein
MIKHIEKKRRTPRISSAKLRKPRKMQSENLRKTLNNCKHRRKKKPCKENKYFSKALSEEVIIGTMCDN